MVSLTTTQNKIATKIFEKIGSSATRKPLVSSTQDAWGDETVTYGSDETVTIVPYDYIKDRRTIEIMGETLEGEVIMAFQYDQSLEKDDIISFDSEDFVVGSVEKFPYAGGFILKLARLIKIID